MKIITSVVLCIMLMASVALAGSGWESDYDIRWDITIIDCSGTVTTYHDCYITNQGQFHVSFKVDGKVKTVTTVNGCTSIVRTEAD
jgi:hypothetical protein